MQVRHTEPSVSADPHGAVGVARTESHRADILLVEDEEDLRRLLGRALRRAGFRVREAACGEDALTIFRTRPVRVVITDVIMPGMNGCELAESVHRLRPEVSVLYMSGFGGDLVPPGCPFLQKPFLMRVLVEEVRRLISS